jgi:hypothetical protein
MAYTLNDYCKLTFNNPKAPRIIVYPNKTIAAALLNHHKSKKAAVASVADCIAAGTSGLPVPCELFPILDKKIQSLDRRVIVVGIDTYLSLLSEEMRNAFFVALRGRIDDGKLNAGYLVSDRHNMDFGAPRYEEGLDIIKVSGDSEYAEPPKVEVVSDKWVKPGGLVDYHTLLKQLGDFLPAENHTLPTGNHTLVLKDLHSKQAGLASNVSFILDIQRIAERFYGVSTGDLESATLELLLPKVKERGGTLESYLETEFVKENIDIHLALKRLLDLPDDDIWMAYIWLLKKRLPVDTYLAKVLSSGVTHINLLRKYVVDTAVTVLNGNCAKKFATERAEALTRLSVESLIVEFIGQTKDVDSVSEFLNCGTKAERIEIVRRVSKLDLTVDLPEPFKRLYPALADYLSNEFDYGTSDLNTYFREYRKLKIASIITEEFAKKAFDSVLPTSVPTRESALLDLRTDETALLVVDGMGAEYFPLILAMARRRGMNVGAFAVTYAKMPTSTEFNPIQWDGERTLDEVRAVDNIAHNGAAKNEHCSPERNIAAVLNVFETEVFNRIADGLSRFYRVVVSADHGTSRLAVLAHKEGFSVTLPWGGEPRDWRYSLAPENSVRPPEFEQQYHPDSGKTYWVVRGYNRLPKSGGKLYELHGGASLEERLVPVVVFTRAKSVVQPKQADKKTTEELIDKFADLI